MPSINTRQRRSSILVAAVIIGIVAALMLFGLIAGTDNDEVKIIQAPNGQQCVVYTDLHGTVMDCD